MDVGSQNWRVDVSSARIQFQFVQLPTQTSSLTTTKMPIDDRNVPQIHRILRMLVATSKRSTLNRTNLRIEKTIKEHEIVVAMPTQTFAMVKPTRIRATAETIVESRAWINSSERSDRRWKTRRGSGRIYPTQHATAKSCQWRPTAITVGMDRVWIGENANLFLWLRDSNLNANEKKISMTSADIFLSRLTHLQRWISSRIKWSHHKWRFSRGRLRTWRMLTMAKKPRIGMHQVSYFNLIFF